MSTAKGRISISRLLMFASPEMPLIGLMMPVVVFLPPLYATYVGIPLETVGLAFLIARLWDVITDPVLGMVADRSRGRFGRRKSLMLLAAPFLMLGVWMAFRPPIDASLFYLIGWMIVLYTSFTIANISHYAWAAELSNDYHERARIMGGLQGAQVVGSIAVLATVATLQGYFKFPQNETVASIGLLIAVLVPITFLAAFLATPEHPKADFIQPAKTNTERKVSGESIWRDTAIWRLLGADFLNGFSTGHVGGLFVFLTGITFGFAEASGQLLLVYYLSGLMTVPIWLKISHSLSKHKAMGVAALINAAASFGALFVTEATPVLVYVFCISQGLGFGAAAFLPRAIMADVIDKDELLGGRQRAATFYALLTMTLKVGMAVSIGVSYWCLSNIGFDTSSLTGSYEAEGVRAVYTVGILLANIPILLLMWNFPLGYAQQAQIRERLAQKMRE